MPTILIADDHTMFVEGLSAFFADMPAVEVIGRCYTGNKVLEFLRDQQPDLILLDISLPEINGLDLCKTIKHTYPAIKVLMLSMHNESSIIAQAMKNGADGYLLKSVDGQQMKQAINTAMQGEVYYSAEVKDIILQNLTHQRKVSQYSIVPKLSRREKEILRLIIDELTTQEIADKLCLSIKTIEAARSQLLSKVGARNIAGLVKAAFELKLLD